MLYREINTDFILFKDFHGYQRRNVDMYDVGFRGEKGVVANCYSGQKAAFTLVNTSKKAEWLRTVGYFDVALDNSLYVSYCLASTTLHESPESGQYFSNVFQIVVFRRFYTWYGRAVSVDIEKWAIRDGYHFGRDLS